MLGYTFYSMQHKQSICKETCNPPENLVLNLVFTLTDPYAVICSKLLAFVHISFNAEYYSATKLLSSTCIPRL